MMQEKIDVDQRIKEHYEELSKGCKQVAAYVLGNHSNVILLSSMELAERAGVSDTTVVRFSKALGFRGYAEFKKYLRDSTRGNGMFAALQSMGQDHSDQYAVNYMRSMAADLQGLVQTIDYGQIDQIARLLLDCGTIYIGGLGSDIVVAEYLFTYLRKMGFNPILLVEEGHTLREYLLHITEQDVLLISSYPKMYPDEQEMAHLAKQAGAKVVALTDSEISAFLLESDYSICVRQREETFFNSYVLPMAISDLLLLRVYELAPEMVSTALRRYAKVVFRKAPSESE